MKYSYQTSQLLAKRFSSVLSQYLALLVLALLPLVTSAQVNLNNTPYEQNFNSLTNSGNQFWTNNQTLPGWYVQQDARTFNFLVPGNGSSFNNDLLSFGDGNSPDRSLGGISSVATGKYVYGLRLKNNTGRSVNTINVKFDLVQYYNNPGNSERFGISYKTTDIASTVNGQLHTSAGWQVVNSKLKTPSKGRPGARPTGDRGTYSLDITGINLAAGQEIIIRFEDAMNTKNKGYNAIGLDNVAITANPGSSAFTEYHYVNSNGKNSNDLRETSNWEDKFGNSPSNFTDDFQLFYIDVPQDTRPGNRPNTQTPTLGNNQTWTVSGSGSKVILGNGTGNFSLTIAPSATFNATIDLASKSALYINNPNNNNPNNFVAGAPQIDIDLVAENTTVKYGGTVPQYISEANYYDLDVSSSSPTTYKVLFGGTSVRNKLTLNATNLLLNESDLIVADIMEDGNMKAGQISRSSGLIFTNGTGSLQQYVPTGSTVVFPIGTSIGDAINNPPSYTPATIVQNGTSDLLSVRVLDGYFENYNSETYEPTGTRVNQGVVNRSWVVEEAILGGSNINLSLLWSKTNISNPFLRDETAPFLFNESFLNYFTGSDWLDILNSGNNRQEFATTRQITGTGLVNLGVFSIGDITRGNTPLPVELLSFKATRVNSQVNVTWATATEKNNDYFTVEQSADGYVFTEVAKVKGAGNSIHKLDYSYLHRNAPSRLVYYRLKQTDFDGTVSYSKMVAVDGKGAVAVVSASPNPSTGRFVLGGIENLEEASVLDATGRVVKTLNTLNEDNSFDLTDQRAGIYFLRLTTGKEVKTLRLIKK